MRLSGRGDGAALRLEAVVDPLSARAQLLAPLLGELRQALRPEITVLLSAKVWSGERHGAAGALPLTSFYRLALQLDLGARRRPPPPSSSLAPPRRSR